MKCATFKFIGSGLWSTQKLRQVDVFANSPQIQEWQFCQFHFSCAIRNGQDQWSVQPSNVILLYQQDLISLISRQCTFKITQKNIPYAFLPTLNAAHNCLFDEIQASVVNCFCHCHFKALFNFFYFLPYFAYYFFNILQIFVIQVKTFFSRASLNI